eukprot:GCRY01001060.1.p1 GENE.GCRY01001060.1~~GCRY01001060.1.p1  ORF type:complete len:132 (-),score=24.50 GCRY01001060.1:118-513(-)
MNEDATKLQLGEIFQNATCLSNSEVHFILQARQEQHQMQENAADLTPIIEKTFDYTKRFGSFNSNKVAMEEAFQIVQQRTDLLHPFEIKALINLLPKDSEEAKSLLPSLHHKIEDDELNGILHELAMLKAM